MACNCGFLAADENLWSSPYLTEDYYASARDEDLLSNDIPLYIEHRVATVRKHLDRGAIADLGAGTGETAIAFSHAGFEVTAVEESPIAIRILEKRDPSVRCCRKTIQNYLAGCEQHDALTLYHVLEHIQRPETIVGLLARSLRSGGLAVIEVPDVASGQARLTPKRWGMYLDHHVNYFTPKALSSLMNQHGFVGIECEKKYHFGWPQGRAIRDMIHSALCTVHMHSIISTVWRKS